MQVCIVAVIGPEWSRLHIVKLDLAQKILFRRALELGPCTPSLEIQEREIERL